MVVFATKTFPKKYFSIESYHIFRKKLLAQVEGILPKGPYPPCLRMADRALLAGYPRSVLTWDYTMLVVMAGLNKANITMHCYVAESRSLVMPQGRYFFTHWGRDKMDASSQTTFSNAFSWMKMHEFRLRFHWSSFLRFELTIFQHWFR